MNTRLIATKPKIRGKIVRAWHINTYIGLIYNGWKAGGLQVRGPLSDDAIPQLIRENCPNAKGITDDGEEEE
jgi:hypothetical protein